MWTVLVVANFVLSLRMLSSFFVYSTQTITTVSLPQLIGWITMFIFWSEATSMLPDDQLSKHMFLGYLMVCIRRSDQQIILLTIRIRHIDANTHRINQI